MAASFLLILLGAISCTYTDLQNSIDDLTSRIEALENFQEQVQGDIASLQEIIAKLQSSVTVTTWSRRETVTQSTFRTALPSPSATARTA